MIRMMTNAEIIAILLSLDNVEVICAIAKYDMINKTDTSLKRIMLTNLESVGTIPNVRSNATDIANVTTIATPSAAVPPIALLFIISSRYQMQ